MKELFIPMYIIVDRRNSGDIKTLRCLKKDCISDFISGTSLSWEETKKYGWKCIKVDVSVTPTFNGRD